MNPPNAPLVSTIRERCRLCYTCVRECPAKAIRIAAGQAQVLADRCIGCGNCVVACPTGAMRLVRKQQETVPPLDTEALHEEIMAHKKGTIGKMRLVGKLMLGR